MVYVLEYIGCIHYDSCVYYVGMVHACVECVYVWYVCMVHMHVWNVYVCAGCVCVIGLIKCLEFICGFCFSLSGEQK